jgi:hypothetical protein
MREPCVDSEMASSRDRGSVHKGMFPARLCTRRATAGGHTVARAVWHCTLPARRFGSGPFRTVVLGAGTVGCSPTPSRHPLEHGHVMHGWRRYLFGHFLAVDSRPRTGGQTTAFGPSPRPIFTSHCLAGTPLRAGLWSVSEQQLPPAGRRDAAGQRGKQTRRQAERERREQGSRRKREEPRRRRRGQNRKAEEKGRTRLALPGRPRYETRSGFLTRATIHVTLCAQPHVLWGMSYEIKDGRWEYRCSICGRLFRRNTNHEGYCSHECELEARRRIAMARAHRTMFSARQCAWCGGTFTPRSERHRYCSTGCRVAAHRAQATREAATPARTCSQCGTAFVPGRRDQCYCSHGCDVAAVHERARARRQGRHRPARVCAAPGCGARFVPEHGNERYGAAHRARVHAADQAHGACAGVQPLTVRDAPPHGAAHGVPRVARCAWCGEPFTAHRAGHRFCSPKCRVRAARARSNQNKEGTR